MYCMDLAPVYEHLGLALRHEHVSHYVICVIGDRPKNFCLHHKEQW